MTYSGLSEEATLEVCMYDWEKEFNEIQFEVVDDGEVYVFDKDRMQYRRVK
jgi:hypothetical protein